MNTSSTSYCPAWAGQPNKETQPQTQTQTQPQAQRLKQETKAKTNTKRHSTNSHRYELVLLPYS